MPNPSKPDWQALAARPEFAELLAAKKRFIIPCCVFFLLFYAALLYMVGWHPDLMKKPLIGKINGAYLFALSQFAMAWAMAWVYMRKAAQLDRMAASVIRDEKH